MRWYSKTLCRTDTSTQGLCHSSCRDRTPWIGIFQCNFVLTDRLDKVHHLLQCRHACICCITHRQDCPVHQAIPSEKARCPPTVGSGGGRTIGSAATDRGYDQQAVRDNDRTPPIFASPILFSRSQCACQYKISRSPGAGPDTLVGQPDARGS